MRVFSALVLVAIASAADLRADCQATASITGTAPDLTIVVNGGGECGRTDVQTWIDGGFEGLQIFNTPQASYTRGFGNVAECMTTGQHTVHVVVSCHKIEGDRCGTDWDPHPWIKDLTFPIDGRPTVSMNYAGPDADGHGTVTIDYNIPNS